MDFASDYNTKDIYKQYSEYLEDESCMAIQRIKEMIENKGSRLVLDINLLRKKNSFRCQQLLEKTQEELLILQKCAKELLTSIDSDYSLKIVELNIGFEGSFGERHVSPRSLSSRLLCNLVCCEGIVTKCSLVRSKLMRSVHYCPKTNKMMEQKYSDLTSLEAYPSSSVYPTKDTEGNPLETEFGLSHFKDYQTLIIQEMPEKSPAGQLPRSINVIVENDLVDICKPGDRVQIVGMYRCLPTKKSNYLTGTFRTVLIANYVKLLNTDEDPNFSAEDVKRIKNFSKTKNLFSLLSRSIAPSIYGHSYIKKAILCQLVGGNERVLDNGTRLRGDINILMVGDPSTAKSQILRYVLHNAPRSIPTTGRGSTGVGLTAAVTTNSETGERTLEAGAMVLADRAIVCIDEFDKMSDTDRTAIHEVMEQGRVTIAKAGIQARLNARCSVLAAANPIYGRYDEYKTPMENINMQDSILSRFDLLFIVLDLVDKENDYMVAEHVLKMHQYRAPHQQDGEVMPFGDGTEFLSTHLLDNKKDSNNDVLQIYEKTDAKLYSTGTNSKARLVNPQFLIKYIHLAKKLRPELTDEAISSISKAYSELRIKAYSTENINDGRMVKTMPVTARSLETLIRISTAHAKLRLSPFVEKSDAKVAIDLVHFSFFQKVEKKTKKKKVNIDNSIIYSESSEKEIVSKSTIQDFKVLMLNLFDENNSQAITISKIKQVIDKEGSTVFLSQEDIMEYLHKMQEENKIMLIDELVYLV